MRTRSGKVAIDRPPCLRTVSLRTPTSRLRLKPDRARGRTCSPSSTPACRTPWSATSHTPRSIPSTTAPCPCGRRQCPPPSANNGVCRTLRPRGTALVASGPRDRGAPITVMDTSNCPPCPSETARLTVRMKICTARSFPRPVIGRTNPPEPISMDGGAGAPPGAGRPR